MAAVAPAWRPVPAGAASAGRVAALAADRALLRRLAWFAGLWAAGVIAVGAVATVLRAVLKA